MRGLGRRTVTLVIAAAGLALVGGGGSLLHAETAPAPSETAPLVGKTTSVCTIADDPDTRSDILAVALDQTQPRPGTLTGQSVTGAPRSLSVTEPRKAASLTAQSETTLLVSEGGMSNGSGGAVFSNGTSGAQTGLMAASCLLPGTVHWFAGVGADDDNRTELVLTNPDNSQAEVDLRYFGRRGRVVVAGSPGITVEGHSSRTISLTPLVTGQGPVTVEVRARSGRVSAVARDLHTAHLQPAGADWQLPSAAPARTLVIPGVPDGTGPRRLVLGNPGQARATVNVAVLGIEGSFAPAGADQATIPPESSVELDLTAGLAGEAGSIRITGDLPVTGAVLSTNHREDATDDIAVQPATTPLVRTGVSALATTTAAASNLVVTNASDQDTQVSFEVISYEGVSLRKDDFLLAANTTATRRLNSPAPSYLVMKVPDRSAIYSGLVLDKPDGAVAGLSTIALSSPDVAGRAPRAVSDPAVAR